MLAFATIVAGCHGHTSASGSGAASPAPARPPAAVSPAVGARATPRARATIGSREANLPQAPAARADVPSPGASAAIATGPRIIALSESPAVVHAGGSIALVVHTSADVASVTGTVSAYTLPFKRTSPGRFELAFAIPANVPGFFHGTYAMNVTARGTDGASASRSVAITFE